ncbi:hypothetical protein V565_157890 [Rhizoctonia solani 123E]|uniref:Uncharacterized protein n=1 Tax=Rhizoctonia solani 123E TaxID=1423351 RepID=A0A074SBI1_9AGAM|nr:hypothetical protein V565_157890 [Rhizoctonia solani 123E]
MPKRNIAGGYSLSSDDSGDEPEVQSASKKRKYEPPRLSVSTPSVNKANPPPFNFPKPPTTTTPKASGSTSTQPKHPIGGEQTFGGALPSMPTPANAPSLLNIPIVPPSDTPVPTPITNIKGKGRAPLPAESDEDSVPDTSVPSGSGAGASRQLLEQRIDEMSERLQTLETRNDERHRETQDQLTTIMKAVEGLHVLLSIARAPALSPSEPVLGGPNAPSEASAMNPKINPPLTPELSTLIMSVVGGFPSRVGKKVTGDQDNNSKKKYAREVFWATFSINGLNELRPPFLDANGRVDYFPEEFVDLKTGYKQPFPDWGEPMTQQMVWVPTLLWRWKAMIPHDTGPTSTMLRNMSDEEALIFLHDGPFKSARNEWGKKKYTKDQLDDMRSNARQDRRAESKSLIRSLFRPEVPAITGPEHDWLFHSGMVSRDVSDNEGEIEVHRNEGIALWVTSFNEAADTAHQKGLTKYRHPRKKKKVVLVPTHIPQLERGKGRHKKIVPIAICAFSKKLRRSQPELFKSSTHLINSSIQVAPDILAFLEKYPKEDSDVDSDSETEAMEAGERHLPEEIRGGGEYAGNTNLDVGVEEEPEEPKEPEEPMVSDVSDSEYKFW